MELSNAIIGKKLRTYSYPVERSKIKEFCTAIGETNPIYLDPAAAREAGFDDTPVPPTYETVLQFWGYTELWNDMTAMGIDTGRLLHAKQEYRYLHPLYPGDVVRSDGEVVDVKTGKLDMVTFQTRYFNQNDVECVEAKMMIIIRPEGK